MLAHLLCVIPVTLQPFRPIHALRLSPVMRLDLPVLTNFAACQGWNRPKHMG